MTPFQRLIIIIIIKKEQEWKRGEGEGFDTDCNGGGQHNVDLDWLDTDFNRCDLWGDSGLLAVSSMDISGVVWGRGEGEGEQGGAHESCCCIAQDDC